MTNERVQAKQPLDDAAAFLDRIIYARREQKTAMVLYFASTHAAKAFNTMGRLLVTSREPMSGKTTVLDAAGMMCHNFWMSDPTRWAIQAKFIEPDGVTLGLDEMSQVFGKSGLRGQSNPLYKPLVEGYRRTAQFAVSVDRSPVEIPSYCPVVMAGLKTAVPADLRTRCIVIDMRPMPNTIELEDSLDEGVESDGRRIGEQLHAWVQLVVDDLPGYAREARRIHPKMRGRRLQICASMYAIARAAGPPWVARFMEMFSALVLDVNEKPVLSAEEQVLNDTGEYLSDPGTPDGPYLLSAQLLGHLRTLDERLYTSKTDAQMGRLMTAGLGKASVLTLKTRAKAKGWHRAAVLADYRALLDTLNPAPEEEEQDEFDDFFDIEIDPTTETTETTDPYASAA